MSSPTDRSDAARLVGRYELAELIGRGGMAEVWRARVAGPEGFRRKVALKRPLRELAGETEFRRMFVAEARILAQLHHPNVVGVFDFGEAEGVPFLVMELIEGWTLARLLRAQRRLEPGFAAFVALELCRGLGYVHQAKSDEGERLGLVHRDLSPSNVMIGVDGSVKLLDFGTAKAASAIADERTRTGVLKGKVPYMSPEQAAGRALDHRSDQFSLGAVLFELLTGTRLFDGDSDAAVLRKVREGVVEPPAALAPGVPSSLDEICRRLLARDPEARFADCDEAAEALAPLVRQLAWGPLQAARLVEELRARADSPQLAPRTGRLERAPRRRWRRVGIVAAALVAGSAALVGWRAYRHGPAPHAARIVETPSPAATMPPSTPPEPAPPTVVRFTIDSRPPGAGVYSASDGTTPLGRTPMSLPLPRGTAPLRFTLRASDYAPATVEIVPDSDQRVSIRLAAAPRPPRKSAPPRADSEEKQLERAIKKGKLVDPFE